MACVRAPKLTKDKGYSWVIVIGSFLSHFAHVGFTFGTAGNLTIAHQEFFKVDLQQGSLIGTVHVGVLFLFGPITATLVKKLGCQLAELLGGFLLIAGVGLSAFSRDLWHAIVLYSVVAGIGGSCCYTASSQILAVYFDRLKYVAFSLAALGYYVGVMTWSILSQFLLNKFGYSQAMGIMASAHLLHIIAGISFLEPKAMPNQANLETSECKINENTGKDILALEVCEISSTNVKTDSFENSESSPEVNDGSLNLKTDFIELIKSWKVWLLLANGMLWSVNSSGFLILVNSYIIHNTEMDVNEAALGVTVIGVSSIIGSISVVLTSSLKFNRFLLYFCAVAFFGAAAIVASFTTSKEMYYGLAACWGLGQSIAISSLLGVVSDLCTASQLPLLFGLQLLAEGIGGIALVPLAAYIGEASGERYGIIFVGCCGVLGALAILPVVILSFKKGKTPYSEES